MRLPRVIMTVKRRNSQPQSQRADGTSDETDSAAARGGSGAGVGSGGDLATGNWAEMQRQLGEIKDMLVAQNRKRSVEWQQWQAGV